MVKDKFFLDKARKPLENNKDFYLSKQNNKLNALTCTQTVDANTDITINDKGEAIAKVSSSDGSIAYAIRDYLLSRKVKTPTLQFLQFLIKAHTDTTQKNIEIDVTVTEYMELRKLKDRKTAIEQIKESIDTLKSISGMTTKLGFISMLDHCLYPKNNVIKFQWGEMFFKEYVQPSYATYLPKQLMEVNGNKNPNTYNILMAFSTHKRINQNRNTRNKDCLTLKTLLKKCPNIQTYENVMKLDRNVKARIYTPFFRDLDACDNSFGYDLEYKDQLIDVEEVKKLSFTEFCKVKCRITWSNYPQIETNYKPNKRKSKENTTK